MEKTFTWAKPWDFLGTWTTKSRWWWNALACQNPGIDWHTHTQGPRFLKERTSSMPAYGGKETLICKYHCDALPNYIAEHTVHMCIASSSISQSSTPSLSWTIQGFVQQKWERDRLEELVSTEEKGKGYWFVVWKYPVVLTEFRHHSPIYQEPHKEARRDGLRLQS